MSEENLILKANKKDLGGFFVRRVIPNIRKRTIGPWIFFDHMGPAELDSESDFNVRPHPHINLATVTYLFEGEILHRDSLGNKEFIRPGDINLMVSGKGITHSEREDPEKKDIKRKMHGLQLWFALPEEDEEIDPAFYHYSKENIPEGVVNDVPFRLLMGKAYNKKSPVKTFSETLYLEARLEKGQEFKAPRSEELAAYVAKGKISTNSNTADEYEMIMLESGDEIKAEEDSFIVLIGGAAIGKRHLFWNFASSRPERIEQAKNDWKEKRFPEIPDDNEEFIPLPEEN